MPGWGEISEELGTSATGNGGMPDFDGVRRKYLANLTTLTGRSVIVYAADFNAPYAATINLMDMQGLMEVFRDLPGPGLDLILHSPGGSADAVDRLVRYVRSRFSDVRVFVPLAAMSAATMWAMSADHIVMGKHSQLGPIDPQIILPSGVTVPAGALLDQFHDVNEELAKDPSKLTGWLPTLQQYPPGLLNVCETAGELAKRLVAEWLGSYMLQGDAAQAALVAEWLSDDHEHLSHSRAITRDQLRERGIKVVDLEDDQALQDAVLSVHHAMMLTLDGSATVKLIENNLGRAFTQQQAVVGFPPGMTAPSSLGISLGFGPLGPLQGP